MNVPSILLGFVIATLIGALFFRFRPSRSYRRLWLCLLVSWVGFAVGHFTAEWLSLRLWTAGSINLTGALPGSFLALLGMQVLSLNEWK